MTVTRLTVPEAAEHLGITSDAVRSRLRRGKLQKEKDSDGTVYVVLGTDQVDGQEDQSTNQKPSQPTVELANSLREQIDLLKDEVSAWREEARRKDHIIAALTERIPELLPPTDTPPEATGARIRASEESSKGEGREEPETAKKRPWWRRIFE